ncbi:MAG: hypothetical protein HFJ55_04160 [Clostridia bacterium]|nr:hypothetical protein [Clostridia bacterium]
MNFLLTLLIGIVAGVIDVLPMIRMKVDKYACISAFVYYLIVPFVIFGVNWFGELWWLRGGIVAILMAIPVIILVAKEDKKSPIAMTIMSIVLGSIIGVLGHFLNLM